MAWYLIVLIVIAYIVMWVVCSAICLKLQLESDVPLATLAGILWPLLLLVYFWLGMMWMIKKLSEKL